MSKEQPTSSVSGVPAKDPVPVRLHTVRVWFPSNPLELMEDIKRNGLDDVVVDAISLQELGTEHQAQDNLENRKDAFLVDLAVLEPGIVRVRRRYGFIRFIPLSSDDPVVLRQSAKDPDLKKVLCYRHLHSKYQYEGERKKLLAAVLGFEVDKGLADWYYNTLKDLERRLEQLNFI
ncbi:hypothetical protein N7516_008930 [Penicillium verrucosum]|uniref:uncharacterized protein n=1 Tax=Penicillium verrucosum TaxID=60171 RepID=UPI0025459AFE|nr:uncharacterized protein N7516_008930 [Penicillium verrucosum]KAJ5927157.1 hypothetical protein N7516_008930 [Penicillium verrucosum]